MAIQEITFAGHSAVFLSDGSRTLAVDPWLEGNPICPDRLKSPAQLDAIILTHGHADHASEAVRLAVKHNAMLFATYELAMIMVRDGVPEQQVVGMNKGGTTAWEGFRISLTNAFHSSSYDGPRGTEYAGEPCGVVIDDGTRRIYHSGDTALFSDIALIKDQYSPEIALLCIGDRFTMGPREAAKAAKLVGCKTAIPIHYGTFPLLTGTPGEFTEECGKLGIEVKVIEPGASLKLEG